MRQRAKTAREIALAISQIDNRQAKPAGDGVMSAEIAGSNFSQIKG